MAQQRCLAGAVGPGDHGKLALSEGERDVVESAGAVSVAMAEAGCLDNAHLIS